MPKWEKVIDYAGRVTENDLQKDMDGGRLCLHADDGEVREGKKWRQVEMIGNALTDEVLAQFPYTREQRQGVRVRIVAYVEVGD